MRSFIAFALVLAACGGGDRSAVPATRTASTSSQRGPDALLLRVPRGGGVARVTSYPNIDSVAWTATDAAPSLDRVLAFDPDAGLIAVIESRGLPAWIDLRVGSVTLPHQRGGLHGISSFDGSTIFAVGDDGAVLRFTLAGTWLFKPPAPAHSVFPLSGGNLLIVGGTQASERAWRIRPPATKILDSLTLPTTPPGMGAEAPFADRVYLATSNRTLLGIRARHLASTKSIEFEHTITDIVATPSGDRFYVITDSSNRVNIVDQYQDRVSGTIELADRPRDLRVDPFGRFLLVRAAKGDNVWVVSVGTDQVVGTVHSIWRGDVPFVAPDGAIAVSDGHDVTFLDRSTFQPVQRAVGGASEFWYPFLWNGLRARAATLDKPVEFPSDSPATLPPPRPTVRDTVVAPPPATPRVVDSTKIGFTVSFAAVLNENVAREQAAKIIVEGHQARIVTGTTSGMTVYRVILGPYPTREEADRVGRASGLSYVVIVGSP